MANYIPGLGTQLKKGTTVVAHRVTITSSQSMGSSDTTNLDSEVKESRATLLDPGTLSCDVLFDPADTGHAAVQTAADTGVTEEWSLIVPTDPATIYTFSGYITDFELNGMEAEGNLTASITIKRTTKLVKTTEGD